MNKHTSQRGISNNPRGGKNEQQSNSVSEEQYLVDYEKQLVRQQQFLKIMALSFHNFLIKSYRNLLQKSGPKIGSTIILSRN